MIRRGLQFCVVVGISALGAAPSLASFTGEPMPLRIYVNNTVQSNAGIDYAGVYVPTGSTESGVGPFVGLYQRYVTDGTEPRYIVLAAISQFGIGTLDFHADFPTAWRSYSPTERVEGQYNLADVSVGIPTTLNLAVGTVTLDWFLPADPYEEAFPDWESAATKIPLGFGMGMAFWASSVALAIPIKWVKDLASAAS